MYNSLACSAWLSGQIACLCCRLLGQFSDAASFLFVHQGNGGGGGQHEQVPCGQCGHRGKSRPKSERMAGRGQVAVANNEIWAISPGEAYHGGGL